MEAIHYMKKRENEDYQAANDVGYAHFFISCFTMMYRRIERFKLFVWEPKRQLQKYKKLLAETKNER